MALVAPLQDADMAIVGERIPAFQSFLQNPSVEGILQAPLHKCARSLLVNQKIPEI